MISITVYVNNRVDNFSKILGIVKVKNAKKRNNHLFADENNIENIVVIL